MIEGEKEKAVSPATLIDPLIPRNLNATMERTDDTSEKVATTPMDHPITAPFGQYSVCTTREETASKVAVIISDRLGFNDVRKQSIVTALQSYFVGVGIENDRVLTMLRDEDWPTEGLQSPEHSALTIPVMRCLKEVTAYTKEVRQKQLYLRTHTTFEDLVTFSEESAVGMNADRYK